MRGKVACALGTGADAEEIAVAENATVGINVIAHGMPWQAGDKIIPSNEEHPGNLIPWYNIAKGVGVKIRLVP